jgi:hypothetical protein
MSIYYLTNEENFGFFKIDNEGYAIITKKHKFATKLNINENQGKKYLTVFDDEWEGYTIGFFNSKVCVTPNWDDISYIDIKEDGKINFNLDYDKKNWKISTNTSDNYIKIENTKNFEICNFNKYDTKKINYKKIKIWKFIKKMNEKTKTKRYVKRIHIFESKEKIDLITKYKFSFEMNLNFELLLKSLDDKKSGKIGNSYDIKTSDEIEKSKSNEKSESKSEEEFLETTTEFTGDLNVWYEVERYKFEDNYIDIILDVAYVKEGVNPGFSENTLIEVDDRGIISFKDFKNSEN